MTSFLRQISEMRFLTRALVFTLCTLFLIGAHATHTHDPSHSQRHAPFAAPARIREPIDTSLDALEAEPAKIWDFAHASAPPPSMSSRKRLPDSAPPPGLRLRDPQQRLPDRIRVCPSAEERSDVSTRAQCRGQGAEISTRRSSGAEQRR